MPIRNVSEDKISKIGIMDNNRQGVTRAQQDFGEQLQKIHSNMVKEELDTLLKDIDKQGKALGETLNIRDLKKFKDLIQKFLDYAVNKMYNLKEQQGWDRRGRHKVYTLVESVNNELENLTQMVLSEQKDNINILAKMDQIRGLLVDIYS